MILLSGNLGDHHAALLGKRMQIENDITSDSAPLSEMVEALERSGIRIHEMRDVTRGGLATVLNEFAESTGKTFVLSEAWGMRERWSAWSAGRMRTGHCP